MKQKIELISNTDRIIERLRKEGKVTTFQFSPEQEKQMMDEITEFKRQSRYKQAMSEMSASKVWVF